MATAVHQQAMVASRVLVTLGAHLQLPLAAMALRLLVVRL